MAQNIRPGVDLNANRGPEIIRYTSVVAVLATFAVVGRIFSRKIQKTTWDASDVMIVLGLIGCWGETITVISSMPCYCHNHFILAVFPVLTF